MCIFLFVKASADIVTLIPPIKIGVWKMSILMHL